MLVASAVAVALVIAVLAPAWIERAGFDRDGARMIRAQQRQEATDGRGADGQVGEAAYLTTVVVAAPPDVWVEVVAVVFLSSQPVTTVRPPRQTASSSNMVMYLRLTV